MEAFDHAYREHLGQLQQIDLAGRAHARGLEWRSDKIVIPFFGRQQLISKQGIVDSEKNDIGGSGHIGKEPAP